MKNLLFLLFLIITGCAKYQVVQSVNVNMYHLHSPRKGIEVVLTKDSLEINKWYRLNQINVIIPTDEVYSESKEKKIRKTKSKIIHESKMNKYQNQNQ